MYIETVYSLLITTSESIFLPHFVVIYLSPVTILEFLIALKFVLFCFFFWVFFCFVLFFIFVVVFDMQNRAQAKEFQNNFTLKHTQTTLKDRKHILLNDTNFLIHD